MRLPDVDGYCIEEHINPRPQTPSSPDPHWPSSHAESCSILGNVQPCRRQHGCDWFV